MAAPIDTVSGSKKCSKKNRKRRAKKEGNDVTQSSGGFVEPVPRIDPVEDLRKRLSEAKLAKDHELANRLRQQLWIAQDLSAGIEPKVSAEDPDALALVQEVKNYGIGKPANEPPTASEKKITSLPVTGDADSKKLKNLRKKLTQIEKLKERQRNGEKLESNQLEKIQSEGEVLEEIQHVEQLLSIPVKI